ncbi:4'-phosphopantetheinyl transferase superfamily protein [Flavobacterium sp. MDT1-60]|uniref:4'-phosphopantetheinyl transferase family protein n=1 Tax=Flavobacterium sp. MDT1-60 TaxID=1979344 RepID=UPI00177F5F38|nr:4'-phosphopantetheinyl transferase superfamily protein [Flavobacterium sp. MDT1-60]QOG04688.1 4'-phosphopantetheinyl transferase superfamily protein [Flavobacterium sp. MDT1-60]
MIYICYSYLCEENHESLLKNELPKFPIDFITKINKFRKWQDAQLSILGRILLFRSIKEVFNIELNKKNILYNEYGKPYFKTNPIHFSISHSEEIVVCTITVDSEIGIDIEKIIPINIYNFESQMPPNEWLKIISSETPQVAFYDYWTKKEAIVKAYGYGQTVDFASFEILQNTTTINTTQFYYKEIKIDENYKCNIASKKPIIDTFLSKISIMKKS